MENLLNDPYCRKLIEKMPNFCSAPLFGSFLTSQPIPVSAHYKHFANTSSSPLSFPLFLLRMQDPCERLKVFLAAFPGWWLRQHIPQHELSCCGWLHTR